MEIKTEAKKETNLKPKKNTDCHLLNEQNLHLVLFVLKKNKISLFPK